MFEGFASVHEQDGDVVAVVGGQLFVCVDVDLCQPNIKTDGEIAGGPHHRFFHLVAQLTTRPGEDLDIESWLVELL